VINIGLFRFYDRMDGGGNHWDSPDYFRSEQRVSIKLNRPDSWERY
jgi:hypothetical protein